MARVKANDRRSVAPEAPEGNRIVKRFHHPGWLGALRDRHRARREFGMLRHLGLCGVPVPDAIEVRRGPRGWEVVMAAVPDARPLEELLREGREPPGGWNRLLAELGRAMARIQTTRADWRDLHPGNVLVDATGKPWLIDFHQAAWKLLKGRGKDPTEILVHVAGLAREHLSARSRLRFLVAWRRERTRRGETGIRFSAEDLAALEERARRERRLLVERGSGRWLRDSSRVRLARAANGITIERKEPLASAAGEPLVLAGLSRKEAQARWIHAARLEEHGLPVLRPFRLELSGGSGSATFERATLAAPLPPRDPAESLGRYLGLLHDRGLDVDRLGPKDLVPLTAGTTSGFGLLPARRLVEIDPLRAGSSRFAASAGFERTGGFLAAYLEAFHDRPGEQAFLRTELGSTAS